jgi:hypothetical protein
MGNGQRYTRLPYPKQGTPASSPSLKEEGHPQAELGEHILLKLYDSQISVIELEENATGFMDSFAMYPFREANEYKG